MEKTLTMGACIELDERDVMEVEGGEKTLYLGGVLFRFNVTYTDTAFNSACIWGVGSAAGAAASGGGVVGSLAPGAIGFATSTADSVNNGSALIDYGYNF